MLNGTHIEPQFDTAVSANLGYGLDVSSPNHISYSKDRITIEAIGGISDPVAQNLRVTLKIYRTGTTNPLEIYRSVQVDLFNETQTDFVVTQVSERLNIESLVFKNVFYDFIERLDSHRRHGRTESVPLINVGSSVKVEAKKILQSENILDALSQTLSNAGISDTKLGLQLFILSLSRLTKYPLHGIVQAPKLLGHTLITEFLSVLPTEQTIELTSISKHALSYAPTEDYWDNKTLVLHRLESIKQQENTLLEYLLQGKSMRLVTQSDSDTGTYHSEQKNVTSSINLITYTNDDYHPLFNGKQSICIPLQNKSKVQEALYDKEIRNLAGLIDIEKQKHAQEVLHHIARELSDYSIYNPIIEQIDLSVFFGNNFTELGKYLKLVNLITILHQYKQNPILTKTDTRLEVQAEYMIIALELYRDCFIKTDKELYFNVESTFIRLKKSLQKMNKADYQSQTFTLKSIRKELGMSPITFGKHLKTLEQYGKIERVGGNNKTGFEYQVVIWTESNSNAQNYHHLLEKLKEMNE
jgi:DNA-binding MarR family transcriptional regulator